MDMTEVARAGAEADAELRSWDWKAALRAEERSVNWLAGKTSRSRSQVANYYYGVFEPPIEWLRDAARILSKGVQS